MNKTVLALIALTCCATPQIYATDSTSEAAQKTHPQFSGLWISFGEDSKPLAQFSKAEQELFYNAEGSDTDTCVRVLGKASGYPTCLFAVDVYGVNRDLSTFWTKDTEPYLTAMIIAKNIVYRGVNGLEVTTKSGQKLEVDLDQFLWGMDGKAAALEERGPDSVQKTIERYKNTPLKTASSDNKQEGVQENKKS